MTKPKITLVTGGTGFIGSALVTRLQALNHRVIVLTRSATTEASPITDRLALTELIHIHSLDEIEPSLAIDAVINLAGEPLASGRWTPRLKQLFVDSRVQTTTQLHQLVERLDTKPRVLVNGSAIGWYGAHQDEKLTEQETSHPCFSHDLCQRWEQEALTISELGVRVCLLRIGVVLGADGGPLEELRKSFKFKLAARLGDGKQWMSWIHLQDLIEMILFLIEDEEMHGPVNATAPEPVTNSQFTNELAEQLRPWLRVSVPGKVLSLLVGEMAEEVLLSGQRVVPAKAVTAGFQFHYPTLASALTNILEE